MSYSRVVWKNREESAVTPLNADNLNNMDIGIQNLDSRMATVETKLNGVTDPRYIVKDWEIDTTTGIIVVKWADNRTQSYDLNLEKIPVNFSMSPDGVITMETADGTKYTADLKRYIKPYVFNDSDVIDVVEDGNNITFNIIKGSITDEYIEGEYLSNCIIAKEQSESAADTSATKARNSADSATLSESYAVGGTGTREDEDSDNAKYYYEQAKAISNVEKATTDKMGIVKIPTDGTITIDSDGTIHASAAVTVDTELDETSTNAIANSAVTGAINELLDDVSTNADNIATNAENIETISGEIETLNTDLASLLPYKNYIDGDATITDLNDLFTHNKFRMGYISASASDYATKHVPAEGFFNVLSYGLSNRGAQIAIQLYTNLPQTTYTRTMVNGEWSAWQKLVTDDYIKVATTEPLAIATNEKGIYVFTNSQIPKYDGYSVSSITLSNFTGDDLINHIPPVIAVYGSIVYLLGSHNATYNYIQLKITYKKD